MLKYRTAEVGAEMAIQALQLTVTQVYAVEYEQSFNGQMYIVK